MKKLIFLLILAALIYAGYMYFVKHENPLSVFRKNSKPAVTVTEKALETFKKVNKLVPENKKLVIELELNKPVSITAKSLYDGQIRLTGIDKSKNTCTIRMYKSSGTLSKTMPVRKVLGKKGTLEVSLTELKEKSAVVSLVISSNPREQIELVK
ncbi:MAG: hypothetical protein V1752_08820 [Candidatus Firestonebacteria bacterium]